MRRSVRVLSAGKENLAPSRPHSTRPNPHLPSRTVVYLRVELKICAVNGGSSVPSCRARLPSEVQGPIHRSECLLALEQCVDALDVGSGTESFESRAGRLHL